MPSRLERLLSDQSPLTKHLEGFRPRSQQVGMSLAVHHSLSSGRNLVVEAGTGVGKSLAYLLPSAFWAVENDRKVIVATYTKALQEQLVQKDLPVIQRMLQSEGQDLRYSLLMGSENYLCMQRFKECLAYPDDLLEGAGDQTLLSSIAQWAPKAGSGLRTRIPYKIPNELWDKINRDPDVCLGRRGSAWESCLYRRDASSARQAHILVVNQFLLLAGLPHWLSYDAVVIDEAHNLEDVAVQSLGITLTSQRLKRLYDDTYNIRNGRGLAARLRQMDAGWRKELLRNVKRGHAGAQKFFDSIRQKLNLVGNFEVGSESYAKRVCERQVVPDTLSGHLATIEEMLSAAIAHSSTKEEEIQIKALCKRYNETILQIKKVLDCDQSDHAYWAELKLARRKLITVLNAWPLTVAETLKQAFFEQKPPVVLTSATLAVGQRLDKIKERLGVGLSDAVVLDSPFDYRTQAAILIPKGIPDPRMEPDPYEEAIASHCEKICRVVPGGVFILFSSWQLLRKTFERIKNQLGLRPIFRQGDLPPFHLLKGFKQAGNGILFGTDTFREGVDIVGPALSCVIITRLPFLSPESPLEEARQEWFARQGHDAFQDYILPKAVIKFRQGFGRLIRSDEDYGAVVVLDPRIGTKRYGTRFLRSIPNCRWLQSLEELKNFFEERSKQPRKAVVLSQ